MGKVIKRSAVEAPDAANDTFVGETSAKRSPIISRDVAEARSDADAIRDKALAEAEEIHQQARASAERIIQEARAEAEQLKESAKEEGYEDGKQSSAEELSSIVARSSQRLQHIEAQAVPQLRDLAVAIARKILGRELELQPEAVVDIVRQALADKARQRREIFLRVHPDDLQMVRENRPKLLEVLSRAKEIGLREDPDVARYGVVIETDAGTIDAQLESQLAVFERVLKETP